MAKLVISRAFVVFNFFLLFATIGAQSYIDGQYDRYCQTPIGQFGECVSIKQCKVLYDIMEMRPLMPRTKRFLRSSMCGRNDKRDDVNVCCPGFRHAIQTISVHPKSGVENEPSSRNLKISNNPNLPSNCGVDLMQKIYGGRKCGLAQFPWLALLEYATPHGIETRCGGSLVSDRYVLTAAHCLSRSYTPDGWFLSSVRLGEYDTSKLRDCISDGVGGEICANAPISVPIEESNVYRSYQPDIHHGPHDIGLIRLSQRVRFTGYIKPICLPETAQLPAKMWVAGWGQTENHRPSDVKLKLQISPIDSRICGERYKTNLGEKQLCAGGEWRKDSCSGDSGSPLMAAEQSSNGHQRWTVAGIVSYGGTPCGLPGTPGVYTKVINYVPWILENLRP